MGPVLHDFAGRHCAAAPDASGDEEAQQATSLGLTKLYDLKNKGVIRVAYVESRAILNGEDVRRVALEGHNPKPRTPTVRRGPRGPRRRAPLTDPVPSTVREAALRSGDDY